MMELNNFIIIALIGIVGGMLSGFLGLGGAVVIIPALVLFLGYSQQMAQGTTLLMLVMPVGSLAAYQYYKAGNADIKTAVILGVAFFISAFISAKYVSHIPQDILRKIFAVVLVMIAIKMFLQK
ncbi:MAG: sulfite exporter TauE/SafE family protein [Candidatus Kapaibacterium sp.]